MNKRPFLAVVVLAALTALILTSCGKSAEKSSESTTGQAAHAATPRIESRYVKMWMIGLSNRRPGLDAHKANTLGGGAMDVVVTGQGTSWFEMVDLDSNGTQEKVNFLWDATNKVMYAFTHDPVKLDDGSMADKGLLVAQFGEGNPEKRDMGSGVWMYATARDTSASGEVAGTLFGCRFDKDGNETECGTGKWSRTDNDFIIETKD
jgi:hypothetical protein